MPSVSECRCPRGDLPRGPARSRAASERPSLRGAGGSCRRGRARCVDDHDPGAGVAPVGVGDAGWSLVGSAVPASSVSSASEASATASRSTFAVRSRRSVAGVRDAERDLERRQDEERDASGSRASSRRRHAGSCSRKPTPRTVSIQRRVAELAPQRGDVHVDRLRRARTSVVSQTSSSSRRAADRPRPASARAAARRSNSFGVSSISRAVERRAAGALVDLERAGPQRRARPAARRPCAASPRGSARRARGTRTASRRSRPRRARARARGRSPRPSP